MDALSAVFLSLCTYYGPKVLLLTDSFVGRFRLVFCTRSLCFRFSVARWLFLFLFICEVLWYLMLHLVCGSQFLFSVHTLTSYSNCFSPYGLRCLFNHTWLWVLPSPMHALYVLSVCHMSFIFSKHMIELKIFYVHNFLIPNNRTEISAQLLDLIVNPKNTLR